MMHSIILSSQARDAGKLWYALYKCFIYFFFLLMPILFGIIIPGASIHAFKSVSGKLEQGTLGFLLNKDGKFNKLLIYVLT